MRACSRVPCLYLGMQFSKLLKTLLYQFLPLDVGYVSTCCFAFEPSQARQDSLCFGLIAAEIVRPNFVGFYQGALD